MILRRKFMGMLHTRGFFMRKFCSFFQCPRIIRADRSFFPKSDLTMDNMLVEIDTDAKTNTHSFKEAHLVDFGHEGIYTLRPGIPSKEVFVSDFLCC